MTFIITPEHKAFEIKTDTTYSMDCWLSGTMPTMYYIKADATRISPLFRVLDNGESPDAFTEEELEESRELAKVLAVEWLEDFLVRLHTQPAVIHCVEDGEIFIR